MTVYVLLFVLSSACCIAANEPCRKGDCGSVSIYLGPRWGAKSIKYPQALGTDTPQVTGTRRYLDGTTERSGYVRPSHQYTTTGRSAPMVRPIQDENYVKDDTGSIDRGYLPGTGPPRGLGTTTPSYTIGRRRQISLDMNGLFHYSYINLTYTGLSGDEVKEALYQVEAAESNGDHSLLSRAAWLFLGYNRISQLPSLVFPVQMEYSLEGLWLDYNPIMYLSATTRFEISRLSSLKTLSLANTGLRYLEDLYTHSLEVIDLSNNRLVNVPPSLMHLQNLRELYLDNNRIVYLYETPFTRLQDLRVLYISGNYISKIFGTPFLSLNFLRELKLSNNSLEEVEQVSVNAVTKVYLGGNPMSCSCRLLDAARGPWPDIVDKDNLTCFIDDPDRLLLVNDLLKQDYLDCPSPWRWVRPLSDRLEGCLLWLHRHGAPQVMLIVCALVASLAVIMVIRRRYRPVKTLKNKVPPQDVPYNVLDDDLLP